jgi:hypothetical protein
MKNKRLKKQRDLEMQDLELYFYKLKVAALTGNEQSFQSLLKQFKDLSKTFYDKHRKKKI